MPASAGLVIGVMGLDAVGAAVSGDSVHGLDAFLGMTGLTPGERIPPEALAAFARQPQGLFLGSPEGARRLAFHNKADIHDSCPGVNGSARMGWFTVLP